MSYDPSRASVISVRKAEITWIANNTPLSYQQVVAAIQNILRFVLHETKNDLIAWINKYVPHRSGQLRMDLIDSVNSSTVTDQLLKIIIGTELRYAQDVSAMSTSQVRHSGSWYEHSGKPAYVKRGVGRIDAGTALGPKGGTRVYLYDPMAIGGFYPKLLDYTFQQIRINLIKAKRMYLGFQRGMSAAFQTIQPERIK